MRSQQKMKQPRIICILKSILKPIWTLLQVIWAFETIMFGFLIFPQIVTLTNEWLSDPRLLIPHSTDGFLDFIFAPFSDSIAVPFGRFMVEQLPLWFFLSLLTLGTVVFYKAVHREKRH